MDTIDKQQLIDAAQALGHELETYRKVREEERAARSSHRKAKDRVLDQIAKVEEARLALMLAAGDTEQDEMDKAINTCLAGALS